MLLYCDINCNDGNIRQFEFDFCRHFGIIFVVLINRQLIKSSIISSLSSEIKTFYRFRGTWLLVSFDISGDIIYLSYLSSSLKSPIFDGKFHVLTVVLYIKLLIIYSVLYTLWVHNWSCLERKWALIFSQPWNIFFVCECSRMFFCFFWFSIYFCFHALCAGEAATYSDFYMYFFQFVVWQRQPL